MIGKDQFHSIHKPRYSNIGPEKTPDIAASTNLLPFESPNLHTPSFSSRNTLIIPICGGKVPTYFHADSFMIFLDF